MTEKSELLAQQARSVGVQCGAKPTIELVTQGTIKDQGPTICPPNCLPNCRPVCPPETRIPEPLLCPPFGGLPRPPGPPRPPIQAKLMKKIKDQKYLVESNLIDQ